MSKIREVLENRNKVERAEKARRKEDLNALKEDSVYRARLLDELGKIDMILDSEDVKAVIIEVNEKELPKFGRAIYSSELAEYDVVQVNNSANKFKISRKLIVY